MTIKDTTKSQMNHLLAYTRRGPEDNIDTPLEAFTPLLPFLSESTTIWEAAWGRGVLAGYMKNQGLKIVGHPDIDFFLDEPKRWDVLVTNPPYSQKFKWMKRCTELGKPWALLLPITSLGAKTAFPYLIGCEVIILGRIDFTGGKAPWFAVCWITQGLELGKQLIFPVEISKVRMEAWRNKE